MWPPGRTKLSRCVSIEAQAAKQGYLNSTSQRHSDPGGAPLDQSMQMAAK